MEVSTVLIISGAILAGAASYGIYKYLKEQNGANESESKKSSEHLNDPMMSRKQNVPSNISNDFFEVKQQSVLTVRERHHAAAQTITDSLEQIFDRSEDNVVISGEKLDRINQDLDNMLR